MEDCLICFSKPKSWKSLPCKHKLCLDCFLRLDKYNCPFCRKNFDYTNKEIKKRIDLNIDYNNWQPPHQLIIPNGFNNYNSINIINNRRINIENIIENQRFSRLNRNRIRRRRRKLSMKEIMDRRQNIRKKCKRKWNRKNGRLRKIDWWNIEY